MGISSTMRFLRLSAVLLRTSVTLWDADKSSVISCDDKIGSQKRRLPQRQVIFIADFVWNLFHIGPCDKKLQRRNPFLLFVLKALLRDCEKFVLAFLVDYRCWVFLSVPFLCSNLSVDIGALILTICIGSTSDFLFRSNCQKVEARRLWCDTSNRLWIRVWIKIRL